MYDRLRSRLGSLLKTSAPYCSRTLTSTDQIGSLFFAEWHHSTSRYLSQRLLPNETARSFTSYSLVSNFDKLNSSSRHHRQTTQSCGHHEWGRSALHHLSAYKECPIVLELKHMLKNEHVRSMNVNWECISLNPTKKSVQQMLSMTTFSQTLMNACQCACWKNTCMCQI